jgi:saccharopine dehydrogenase-like NADP-dependent oxidoreductase
MLGVFAKPVTFRRQGEQQVRPGFTVKREMNYPEPFGRRSNRLINWVEASVLSEKLGVHDVNYWTGFDEASFEGLLVLLKKIGLLGLFNVEKTRKSLARMILLSKGGKRPDAETIALTVEVNGQKDGSPVTRCLSMVGPSDYGTTAMCVVAMTRLLLEGRVKAEGVCVPLEVFLFDAVVETMDSEDVKVHPLAGD